MTATTLLSEPSRTGEREAFDAPAARMSKVAIPAVGEVLRCQQL
jgi:hypothetical protein